MKRRLFHRNPKNPSKSDDQSFLKSPQFGNCPWDEFALFDIRTERLEVGGLDARFLQATKCESNEVCDFRELGIGDMTVSGHDSVELLTLHFDGPGEAAKDDAE